MSSIPSGCNFFADYVQECQKCQICATWEKLERPLTLGQSCFFKFVLDIIRLVQLDSVKHEWRVLKAFLCLSLTVDTLVSWLESLTGD